MLKECSLQIGSQQIQNLGTIGGNLCNASPAADGVPCLLSLDASIELLSINGKRVLKLEDFIKGSNVALVLGDNLFYGKDFIKLMKSANEQEKATIFAYPVVDPERYGVVEFDKAGNVLTIEEKPNTLKKIILENTLDGTKTTIDVNGAFIAIGHDPATSLFIDKLKMDEENYIITKPDSTETSIKGVFAAGDVKDKIYRQAVTAAGMGCMAALEAEKYIAES